MEYCNVHGKISSGYPNAYGRMGEALGIYVNTTIVDEGIQ
jgi:hypothetical protein